MRGSRGLAGAAVALGTVAVLQGCSADPPHEDRHAGWGGDRQLSTDLAYFQVELPHRVGRLAWSDSRDWDITSLTLAFRTDRSGVRQLLDRLGLPPSELRPLDSPPPGAVHLGDHVVWHVAGWHGARERHNWAPVPGGADMITSADITLIPGPATGATTTVLLQVRNGV